MSWPFYICFFSPHFLPSSVWIHYFFSFSEPDKKLQIQCLFVIGYFRIYHPYLNYQSINSSTYKTFLWIIKNSLNSLILINFLLIQTLFCPVIIFILSFVTIMCLSESEVAQSCLTLCDPMDCSLPHSSVHGILQARILEWVAIS